MRASSKVRPGWRLNHNLKSSGKATPWLKPSYWIGALPIDGNERGCRLFAYGLPAVSFYQSQSWKRPEPYFRDRAKWLHLIGIYNSWDILMSWECLTLSSDINIAFWFASAGCERRTSAKISIGLAEVAMPIAKSSTHLCFILRLANDVQRLYRN